MKNKMMISILILLVLGITVISSYAETQHVSLPFPVSLSLTPEDTSDSDSLLIVNNEFDLLEEEAKFPGGDAALESYFFNNIQYPLIALEQKIEGTVNVSFIINENGYVDQVEILEEIGGGCEEVIMSALYNMPKWQAKKQAGHYVKSKNKFSFTFQL